MNLNSKEGEYVEAESLQSIASLEAGSQTDTDAVYQQSLLHFQNGEWQDALAGFQDVLRLCPDHAEARAFLEETRLKASLDQDKPKPKRFRLQAVKRPALILIILSLIVALGMGLRWAYGHWVEPGKALQQQELQKAQQLEQAYQYLAERDYVAAEEAFRTFLAKDPTNQEAQEGLAEVERKAALAESYAQAQQAIARQDWDEALRILGAIIEQDPGYKGVQAQQAHVQEQQQLSILFDEAEEAYHASDWQEAISSYETLTNLDTEYQKQSVTEHLFECYLKLGISLVQTTKGESEAVHEAQDLYQKALALQPQQPEAMQETALAKSYLEGQTRLAQGDVEGAIAALEWVHEQRPDYADGNAAALLKTAGGDTEVAQTEIDDSTAPSAAEGSFQQQYDSLMQQGDTAIAAGDYTQAEQYYRQATSIAIHGGYNSARWLFAAYVKAGTASARKDSYEQAVEQARTAIRIMTKSAIAIPSSSYANYIEQGDRYVEDKDYQNALAEYDKALRVIGQKCDCGLENWSILP